MYFSHFLFPTPRQSHQSSQDAYTTSAGLSVFSHKARLMCNLTYDPITLCTEPAAFTPLGNSPILVFLPPIPIPMHLAPIPPPEAEWGGRHSYTPNGSMGEPTAFPQQPACCLLIHTHSNCMVIEGL